MFLSRLSRFSLPHLVFARRGLSRDAVGFCFSTVCFVQRARKIQVLCWTRVVLLEAVQVSE